MFVSERGLLAKIYRPRSVRPRASAHCGFGRQLGEHSGAFVPNLQAGALGLAEAEGVREEELLEAGGEGHGNCAMRPSAGGQAQKKRLAV